MICVDINSKLKSLVDRRNLFSAEMSADSELSAILNRRQNMNDAMDNGQEVEHKFVKVNKNIYTEFSEFSRKEIKEYENKFKRYNQISSITLSKDWRISRLYSTLHF